MAGTDGAANKTLLNTPGLSLSPLARVGQRTAMAGLLLYAIAAPHSVAVSSIAVGVAGLGWLIRSAALGSLRLTRSKFDLPIFLLLIWTAISSVLSTEARISLLKFRSSWCVFLFYLVPAVVTRRFALLLVSVLILSGIGGSLYSIYDLVRGRGVVVQSISSESPLRRTGLAPGDVIWRVGKQRIYTLTELDSALKYRRPNEPFSISIISQGEHVERPGVLLSIADQAKSSPSGIAGTERTHRFRASGLTRHYETFAELLQLIAQLALGIALANLRNHGANKLFRMTLAATVLLTIGLALTAMRTVIIALLVGASVIAWRSLTGMSKVIFTFPLFFVLAFGAVVVWQTRPQNALQLTDPSSSLRSQVARVGLSRIWLHPIFGHGMDAMQRHWSEWGFPGTDMVHLHSTPLQLAFDRGLPALLIWLWLMGAFWLKISESEYLSRDLSDTNLSGVLLGSLGALTGFLASSLVNYNFGDSEVAMMLWCLMGIAIVMSQSVESETRLTQDSH